MAALKKLRPQHFTMAALRAAGWKWREIAAELNLSEDSVRATGASPLFKLEVQRLTRQNVQKISDNYVDQVMQDAGTNVRFLKAVRDGAGFDDPWDDKAIRHRLTAGLALFDRQMPKKQEGDAQPVINITLTAPEQRVMAESCRDAGLAIPHLDDVIADFEQVEADRAANPDA